MASRKYEQRMKELALNLKQAGIHETPEKFVKKMMFISIIYTLLISVAVIFAGLKYKVGIATIILLFPIAFFLFFSYFLKFPEMKSLKRGRDIEREAVFVGRFLLIEITSGVTLYQALKGVAENFDYSGRVFRQIVDNIKMGTSMEEALNKAVEECPSKNLSRIIWQITNALQTGTDITKSLNSITDQISKEQEIDIKQYGKKLNPLAMFYMVLAVIIPSLGISMLIILSTLINFKISLAMLLIIAGFVGFVQFMFISIIKSSRPAVGV
jgi:flagellar protein FlaJ